ncbi:hypothetical protein IB024_04995 [Brucella sp. 6810]|uniref:hypothetical protein n=1 Tax=Brucella sp. 6810 TaxID=2769351 RepID=UPI00165B9CF1|nr:hypothetical protein [Brucella sp. 6810]QNQ63099.1 hypothetical protein IB024_04995 [Brucella sp. 6810]
MATYIDDRQYSDFLSATKEILIDNPGIAPMAEFQLILMEKLHIFPVSAAIGDQLAFESVAAREASDMQLADVLDCKQYAAIQIAG